MGGTCQKEADLDSVYLEGNSPFEKKTFFKTQTGESTASEVSDTGKSKATDKSVRKKVGQMNKPSLKIFKIVRPEFTVPVFDPLLAEKYKKLPFSGPIMLEDKSTYEGQLKKRQRYGFGEAILADGSMYEGYWDNDKRNGIGRHFMADGRVYDGFWANDLWQGQGRLYTSQADYYEGSFEVGKRSGFGKYSYSDGSFFEGIWKDDNKCGEGLYFDAKSKKLTPQIWATEK